MDYEIRPIVPEEYPAFTRVLAAAFGERPDEVEVEIERRIFECDRSLAAFDDGAIVGTAGALSLTLTLPGLTTLPVAGVTWVGVLPTHRRRGILRALMRRQLDDVRARGEALAVLMASESSIYGRFGYGPATQTVNFEIERSHAAFARPFVPDGRFTFVDQERAAEALYAVYDRARRLQPGAVNRSIDLWQALLRHPEEMKDGAGPRFYVAYEPAPGQVDGMAVYRVKSQWNAGLPGGTLLLRELIATTPQAAAALWHYCFNVDLVGTVQAVDRPPDEPLRWLLAEPRRLRVTALTDDLWVRIVDLAAALGARRYAASDGLVIDLHDAFCPHNTGRYALEGGPEGAICRATTSSADLALGASDLGAAYLGGVRFSTLARAGRVEELTPGALRRADALFACEPASWCATPF